MKIEGKKKRFADWLIDLVNRCFGLSTDAFLKSVKKFLDKEVGTIPFNSRSRSLPDPSHLLCFISRCYVPGVIAEILEVANNPNLNKNRGSTVRGDR